MRRCALFGLSLVVAGLLSGCTGTGVFLDHTFQWYGSNPNTPAGSSETFRAIRGEPVDVLPLLPEKGNVWPENQGPDQTLQDLEKQQAEEIRRGQVQTGTAPAIGPSPNVNRANQADQGLPSPKVPGSGPPPGVRSTAIPTPNGPALDTTGTGTGRGYRNLQSGPGGGSVLVPNGNGTSTLIGPDGSVKTVPSAP